MMKTISSTISSPRLKTALQSTSISRFPASVQLKNSEGVRSPVNKFLCCSTLRFVSQLENETKDFAEDRPRPNTNSRSDSVSEDNGGREESSDTEIEDQRCNKNAESEPERIPLTGKRKHAQDYALLLSMPHYYSQCFRQGTTADTHRWQEKMPPDTNNEACCDI
ncbi:hypothetical protein FOZ62_011586 [Perkinsus olseni]|uniref:Uncharacterized protein n=1 Tax=Perkinsus olseni TaxID=32597 RepID=A0A7J6U446_PEROL|nr:hypothetical protein FOZ62_011586 [Perkinsus olseni]